MIIETLSTFPHMYDSVMGSSMMQRAQEMGANAIVGIDIDYETIGESNSMLMVATSGTAVVI